MKVLEVRGVSYTHERGTPFATTALHGVDLDVGDGEFVALLGPSRSGKSTLSQVLNGLLRPESGEVLISGEPLQDNDSDRLRARRAVGVVMQYPEAQLFAKSVGEDVAFGPRNLGVSDVDGAVDDALRSVDLDPSVYLDRGIGDLSGGQRRRVAMAGVLACRPQVLVVDEPTAGIDPGTRIRVLRILSDLADKGTSVIAVSNSSAEFALRADRIVVLERGHVVAQGKPSTVLAGKEMVERTGIGVPDAVEVLSRVRSAGLAVADGLTDETGAARRIAAALAHRAGRDQRSAVEEK
jgi:energy-coupling factor transport system ATP-binding protein